MMDGAPQTADLELEASKKGCGISPTPRSVHASRSQQIWIFNPCLDEFEVLVPHGDRIATRLVLTRSGSVHLMYTSCWRGFQGVS